MTSNDLKNDPVAPTAVASSQNAQHEHPSAPQKALSSDTGILAAQAFACAWP
jgi:hypothetical protein